MVLLFILQLRTKEVIHISPEHEQVDSWIDYNNAKDLTGNMSW
nr:MAG TPA: hypothetical protein [Caudoviricetes sp.]DAT79689.1 MAG TPA: hypothetical protein [Caudoviricetes sp.]